MKKPNPIRIPAELTGAGDIYVIPDTVQEIVGSFASLKIAVQHAGTIELNPEPKRRMLARGELTSLLFSSGIIAKADELFALTKRWLNPEAVEAVNFTGGVLRFALRGGREVCVLGTFDKYRAVMALLYGPDAAGALHPASPPPAVPRPKIERPKFAKPLTHDEQIEIALSSSATLRAPKLAKILEPKIKSTDMHLRFIGVDGVLSKIETEILPMLQNLDALSDEDAASAISIFARKLHDVRNANGRLLQENGSAALACAQLAVTDAELALQGVPIGNATSKDLCNEIARQLSRLSDLQPCAPRAPQADVEDEDEDEAA